MPKLSASMKIQDLGEMGICRAGVIPCGFPGSLLPWPKLLNHCPFSDMIFTKRKVSMSPFNSTLIETWEVHKRKKG